MSKRSRNFGQQAAAALKYNPDMSYAPVVVASGLGELAKKIINIGGYSNGKKTVSKTARSTALTRDMWVRLPRPPPP